MISCSSHNFSVLSTHFSFKDLGDLHYFLGIEVVSAPKDLFLSQHKYIQDLIEKTGMAGAKEVTTPSSTLVFSET